MTTAADWSGRVGEVWAEEWSRTERTFAGLEPLLEEAILGVAPEHGRFLDIGCGVGATSLAVARARPDAHVLGVDLSPGMVDVARSRAADTPNVGFVAGDVLNIVGGPPILRNPGLDLRSGFSFPQPKGSEASGRAGQAYDLLFSRHGVMFFPDPAAAFSALRRAAAPGAPLVFSCFAPPADNPWTELLALIAPAEGYTPGPFAVADPTVVHQVLAAAGWTAAAHHRANFTYTAGEGADCLDQALALFTRIGPAARLLADAALDERDALRERLRTVVAPHRTGDTVAFPAAAWLWMARA